MSKTIFELPSIDGSIADDSALAVDTGIETFKITVSELATYVRAMGGIAEEVVWTTNEYEDVDVSALTTDARPLVWAIKNVAAGYDQEWASFSHPTSNTTVRITASLAAGTYLLVGR